MSSLAQPTYAPLTPTLSNATQNSITVTITADGNPATTTYSIYCTTTGQWVQANGILGSTEVMQTAATWGNTVVTGLSASTDYCFYAIAYDSNMIPSTGTGSTIMAKETFATSSNFSAQSGSGPTNMFWSPSSCSSGGLTYTASGGCTDGYVGKTGNWTNYFGCFLRTPTVNCTGEDSVTLNLDISHSYFANQVTGDKIRFYMWVDGGYEQASSIKIGGQEVGYSDINGLWLRFTEARSCANVSVTFDLASVSNASSILFYIEPNNGYNNSNTFEVKLDNISLLGGGIPVACLSTTAGCLPINIITHPTDEDVCNNDNTSFSIAATGDIAGYQWQVSSNGVNGPWVDLSNTPPYSNTDTINLNITGATTNMDQYAYRCRVEGDCLDTTYSFVAVLTVNPLPTVVFNPADTFFCVSDNPYDLSPYSSPSGGYWSGVGISSTYFIPSVAGVGSYNITYTYTDLSTGCTNQSPEVFVVEAAPTGVGNLAGPMSTCGNEQLTFTYTQANSQYAWSYPNGWTGTADSSVSIATLTPDASGTISVAEYNSCGSGPSASVTVTVNTPPVAGVVVGGATFYASGGVHYEWLDCENNYAPLGDTGAYYTPSDPYHRYAAIVYDANGCTDTTDCVQLFTVGEGDLLPSAINIYPNPTGDFTTITLPNDYKGGNMVLYNLNGRTVKSLSIQEGLTKVWLDMSDLGKGLYTLQLIEVGGLTHYLKVARE